MNGIEGQIEEIILSNDVRGMARLAKHMPADFCKRAADHIVNNRSRAMLITGFYVNGSPETDGPTGTAALADALLLLDFEVVLVTDAISLKALETIAPRRARCVEFPTRGHAESRELAHALIEVHSPSIIGYIERPGLNQLNCYMNMHGSDITQHCGMTDYLLDTGVPSFAVGDGGNEAGMGKYADALLREKIINNPSTCVTDEVVAASVSNWGAFGIVAYLSIYRGRDLLPELEIESARIRNLVRVGAVDGFSGRNEAKVDGRSLNENLQLLGRLKDFVDDVLGP